jgi:hypothetical protein
MVHRGIFEDRKSDQGIEEEEQEFCLDRQMRRSISEDQGVFDNVRKTGPRSNKIKQMRKQNTEDTQYKRDTDLRGSPSVGYVHQRNCQVLSLLLSSKMKGYNLQQNPL